MAIIILAAVFLAGAGVMILGLVLAQKEEYEKAEVIFETEKGEVKFLAEVADNTIKRTRGLSGKESLGEKEGMLFVYTVAGKPGFWMKEMNFAIDIIWIKGEEVVGVTKGASPESYKEGKIFYSEAAVDKILEIKAGEAEKNNIKAGDKVRIVFDKKFSVFSVGE